MEKKSAGPGSRGLHSGKTIDGKYSIGNLRCQDSLGGLYECTDNDGDEWVIRLFSGGITVTASKNTMPLHPNILVPTNVSTPGKLPRYAVLDPMVKTTLRDWMKTQLHSNAEELIGVMLQLTNAVHAVHETGAALGNICPETVFIGEDFLGKLELYLIDAQIKFSASNMTQKLYQSPAQLKTGIATADGDIWSIGAMLYEAMYRRKPYSDKTKNGLLKQIETEPLGFATFKKVPADFIGVIKKCLSTKLEDRYEGILGLGGDLVFIQQQLGNNVSSEAVQKSIRDSIPPAKRVSVAPDKRARSGRISLSAPPERASRPPGRISQVPPKKIPAKKRPVSIAPTAPTRTPTSRRLSRPPKDTKVNVAGPSASRAPSSKKRASSSSKVPSNVSASPWTDPFATEMGATSSKTKIAWPDETPKAKAQSKIRASAKTRGTQKAQQSRPAVKKTQVRTAPEKDVAAMTATPMTATTAKAAEPNRPPIAPIRPSLPQRSKPPQTPTTVSLGNKRPRTQTVAGIPAISVTPKSPRRVSANSPEMLPATATPETDTPSIDRFSQPIASNHGRLTSENASDRNDRDRWSLPPRDITPVDDSSVPDSLFSDISESDIDLPITFAARGEANDADHPEAPIEDTPHPGHLPHDSAHHDLEHRNIEKSARRAMHLRNVAHQLTETVSTRTARYFHCLAQLIKRQLANPKQRLRDFFSVRFAKSTISSEKLKQLLSRLVFGLRTQLFPALIKHKRLVIAAASLILLFAFVGLTISLLSGKDNEQQGRTMSPSRHSASANTNPATPKTEDADHALGHTTTDNAAASTSTDVGTPNRRSSRGARRSKPVASPFDASYNAPKAHKRRHTPKYKRRSSFRNSDTDGAAEEKYRDRTITRGEDVSEDAPDKSERVSHRNNASSRKKGRKGKKRKSRTKKAPVSGWASNPFGD